MKPIVYIDRQSGTEETEQVYCGSVLRFLYGKGLLNKFFGSPLLYLLSRFPFFSVVIGWWQSLRITKSKILPFIHRYHVDAAEFLKPPQEFSSFNDFFIRELKPQARPLAHGQDVAIIPADGRYLFFPNIQAADGFVVKGEKFDLGALLQNKELASRYVRGTMVMARLCPTDYHRFHFPCECIPSESKTINGWLYSVNPIAIKQNIEIFTRNKRTLCILDSEIFGKILYLEIGATGVGAIHETYLPYQLQPKGAEKGYFSFGGSSLILLFEPDRIVLDKDLVDASRKRMEIKCLMGQSMGQAKS